MTTARDEADYAAGRAAGETAARAEPGPLPASPVLTGVSPMYAAGYRVGRAAVRNTRHLARAAAETAGLMVNPEPAEPGMELADTVGIALADAAWTLQAALSDAGYESGVEPAAVDADEVIITTAFGPGPLRITVELKD
jgi:hypothetical protein